MAKIDHAERMSRARQIVIDGLAAGEDIFVVHRALADLAIEGDLVLAETLMSLAAEVIALGGFSPSEPLEYEGFRETYLPEIEFRGKVDHRNSQYAIYAAGLLHGGVVPDIVSDTSWWRSELWPYAFYGLVAYLRAAAKRRRVEPQEIVAELADSLAIPTQS